MKGMTRSPLRALKSSSKRRKKEKRRLPLLVKVYKIFLNQDLGKAEEEKKKEPKEEEHISEEEDAGEAKSKETKKD